MAHRLHPVAVGAAFAVAAATLPARAQTYDEAVRANLTLAISLCFSAPPDQALANDVFTRAGFIHQPEDFGGGEVVHWFAAPAETATVLLDHSNPNEPFCAASSRHLDVTQAVALAGEALGSLFPGVFDYGNMENTPPVTVGSPTAGTTSCTGYIGWNGQRPIHVSIGNAGQDPRCIADGTSQIMIRRVVR